MMAVAADVREPATRLANRLIHVEYLLDHHSILRFRLTRVKHSACRRLFTSERATNNVI
jgi:hypothetical protein